MSFERAPLRFAWVCGIAIVVAIALSLVFLRSSSGDAEEVALAPRSEPSANPADANDRTAPHATAGEPVAMRTEDVAAGEATITFEGELQFDIDFDVPPPAGARDGWIIAVDRDGNEHPTENGSFVCDWLDAVGKPVRQDRDPIVDVLRGRFRVGDVEHPWLRFRDLRLGGRPAVVEETVGFSSIAPIKVHASLVGPIVLRIVDETTREELSSVTAITQTEWMVDRFEHPGTLASKPVVARNASSPLTIPPPKIDGRLQARAHFWVSAADHAWQDVSLEFDGEGTDTVELGTSGSLIITIEGDLSWLATDSTKPEDAVAGVAMPSDDGLAWLRLRRPSSASVADERTSRGLDGDELGRVVTQVEARAGEMVFEGLGTGSLVASIELGERYRAPRVLCQSAVDLRESETQRLTLTPAAIPRVALSGTLFFPVGSPPEIIELQVTASDERVRTLVGASTMLGLQDMSAVSGRSGWYRWSVGSLVPGKYQVLALGRALRLDVDVGSNGRDDIVLELMRLTVKAVEVQTLKPVAVDGFRWQTFRRAGSMAQRTEFSLPATNEDGVAVGYVPAGPGRVFADMRGEWELVEVLKEEEPREGEREISVAVRHRCGVRIELRCDGKAVALTGFDSARSMSIEAAGHSGRLLSWSSINETASILVSDPGWYRVTLPKLNGYSSIETFEVFVEAEQIATRVIELRRE